MIIIPEAALRARIGVGQALEAARRAFHALGSGSATQPMPICLDFPGREAEAHIKPAYLHGSSLFVVKVATGFYDLPDDLPTGSGAMVVMDADNGSALGVLADNGYLTNLRTGAAGAVAVDLLAPPQVAKLAIIGTGVQARFQLEAVSGVRDLDSVVVWGRDAAKAQRYATDMAAFNVQVAETAEAAIRDADLVITTTCSKYPVVRNEWLSASATVVAIGSDAPHKHELDEAIVGRADKVIVDDWSQCLRRGEIHHAVKNGHLELSRIHAELGKVVVGSRVAREADELIVCDFTGVGALDAALAELAWSELAAP